MRGYIANIEKETEQNNDFRRVLYTAMNSQLVVMSLRPGEDIGLETHDLDQFIRIEDGEGVAILNGEEHRVQDDDVIVIPAGTEHNVMNTSGKNLKLYTLYSPPEHKHRTVHPTKADARADEDDHFDGETDLE